jgi:predicted metal-dependent phosphoesterase TrpH
VIDLHCHSIFSDGTDTPEALAEMAEACGLTAIALTDHDTLDGLPRFLAAQATVRTRLIPGLELSCRFKDLVIHVLGLFIDPWYPSFQEHIDDMQRRREERNTRMIERLHALNIPITLAEVAAVAPTHLLSRSHFAKVLIKRGVAGSRQDVFARLIGEDCPGYVPFRMLTPAEAARWISEAGGVAVVAHPGRSAQRGFRWNEAMRDLRDQGIVGFEAYYGEYGPAEQQYFCNLARDLDMVACGGSDYHGASKQGLFLGTGRGNLRVPDEILEALEARRPRRNPDPGTGSGQTEYS